MLTEGSKDFTPGIRLNLAGMTIFGIGDLLVYLKGKKSNYINISFSQSVGEALRELLDVAAW